MSLEDLNLAIRAAEQILPGVVAPDGEDDPRWEAVICVSEFVKSHPDKVWAFAHRWGCHEDEDLRSAIATCVLEHLLEYHFDIIFPRVEQAVGESEMFADTFSQCWKFGEASLPENEIRFDQLQLKIADKTKP